MILVMCDASLNHQAKIGCAGFMIGKEISNLMTTNITIKTYDNIIARGCGNTLLELNGSISAIKQAIDLYPGDEYILYTDCESICTLPGRRAKIQDRLKKKRSRGQVDLANAYESLLFLLEGAFSPCAEVSNFLETQNIKIEHVSGHKPSSEKNNTDFAFSRLDKAVRKYVRSKVNQTD